jgi:UDP-N-acetylmuramate dehydrogenase
VKAKYFAEIHTEDELLELFASEIFQQEKTILLGGGAKTFFTGDVEGLVLKIGMKGIEILPSTDPKENILVRVAAGENRPDFVEYANQHGRAGIENLVAIPGNVGTAPLSNIGAYGREVGDFVVQVEGYDLSTREKKLFSHEDCKFAYRNSIFKSDLRNTFLITHVVFQFTKFDEHYHFLQEYPLLQEAIAQSTPPKTLAEQSALIAAIREERLPDVKKI